MRNVDHLRSRGTQYENMLNEYAQFVAAAGAKLSREPQIRADSIDDLQRRLSSLSVSRLIQCLIQYTGKPDLWMFRLFSGTGPPTNLGAPPSVVCG